MRNKSRSTYVAITLLALSLSIQVVAQMFAGAGGLDLKGMDPNTKPCQDFYQYANSNWLAQNPIPPDRSSWGTGSVLYERNLEVLHQILEEAAKDKSAPKGSPKRLVGDFYRSGMDEARIEAEGVKPLAAEFARINAIKDVPALQDEIARLHRYNVGPLFGFFVYQDFKDSTRQIPWLYQGGLGLPDRDYYFKDDDKTKEIRKEYLLHLAKMLELLGDKPELAAREAQTIMGLETRLAKVSMTVVEQRDPNAVNHLMNVQELDTLTPTFSWTRYFLGLGLKDPKVINVAQPNFFKEVGVMMKEVSAADWQTYLRWQLINAEASRLSSAFVNQNFHFNGQIIGGAKELRPRWKRVLQTTDQQIGEALGQLYVERAFTPQAKARAMEMVLNLKAALRDRIQALAWISDATRQQALKKLDAMAVKIGYPDKWRDYSTLDVSSDSYVTNAMETDFFEFRRNLNKLGRPVDRTEWGMTPPTVDAYFNPNFNEIVFPAGILQYPFFDPAADDALNYGAIGSVIGHELTHGFDDQGRQFDAEGNLKNWWTADDEKNYNTRASLVEKQFDQYIGVDDIHVNGKLTLGENIADLGGLKIAYLALQKALAAKTRPGNIDGFTPEQRFFIAFAQGWRRNSRPELVRLMLATDPHSPPRFRVLGPLSNTPEFFKAFDCRQGDQMVRAADMQAQIW